MIEKICGSIFIVSAVTGFIANGCIVPWRQTAADTITALSVLGCVASGVVGLLTFIWRG